MKSVSYAEPSPGAPFAPVLVVMSAIPVTLEATHIWTLRPGDPDAFAEAVQPYASLLYRRALRLTGNPADAEDAKQEALLKAYSRLGQFTGSNGENQNDFRAWVSRITENSSIDLIRRRRTGKLVSLQEPSSRGNREESGNSVEETILGHIAVREDNPEERLARKEMRTHLCKAILRLAPELRQACLLRDVLQYSTLEVATRLGISTVAVRLRLFRAHRKLREEVQNALNPPASRVAELSEPHKKRRRRPSMAPSLQNKFLAVQSMPRCFCGD